MSSTSGSSSVATCSSEGGGTEGAQGRGTEMVGWVGAEDETKEEAKGVESEDCLLSLGRLQEDWRDTAGLKPARERSAHTAAASSAFEPVSPLFLRRAMHTWPRLGSPHCWQRFLDACPQIRSLRPFSIRCQRLRTDETERPGRACTILDHLGPCISRSSMIVRSSSGSHARMFSWLPPGIGLATNRPATKQRNTEQGGSKSRRGGAGC